WKPPKSTPEPLTVFIPAAAPAKSDSRALPAASTALTCICWRRPPASEICQNRGGLLRCRGKRSCLGSRRPHDCRRDRVGKTYARGKKRSLSAADGKSGLPAVDRGRGGARPRCRCLHRGVSLAG